VFGSGASLSAGAAAAAVTPPAHAGPARRLAVGAALAEGVANEFMHHRLGEHGEPYRTGAGSLFSHISRACTAAGAAVMLRRGASSRPAAIAAGALLCAGALSARWSIYKAGFQSAADPKYVVGPQRQMIERRERRGASRRTANVHAIRRDKGSPATARVELSAS
jgi:hypothetical protein